NPAGLKGLTAKIARREPEAARRGVVDIRDSRGFWRGLREQDVCLHTFQPRAAKISRHYLYASDGGNLQQINGDDAPAGLDPGSGHLRPAARRGAQVYDDGSRPQKLFLVVYFEKLERRAGAIALLTGLAHVRIGDMAAQPLFVRLRHAPSSGESGSTAGS